MGVTKNVIVQGANKKALSWLYFAIIIVVIIIVIVIAVSVFNASKNSAKSLGNLAADTTKAADTGISLARIQQIRNAAETMWTKGVAGYGQFWRPVNYDEEMFIQKINSMTSILEVQLLCQYYNEVAKESLAASLDASFDEGNIAALKTGYYSTIKAM